jgi:hypothetical protein
MIDTGEWCDLNIVREVANDPERTIALNASLVIRQGLDQERVDTILDLHEEKIGVFKMMEDTDDAHQLQGYAKVVTDIEFRLQEAWGFPKDKTFHDWFVVPGCTCPILDNYDRKGTPYGVINGTCPIHA